MRTHYDNLNVSEKASPEVIRAAYKALSQKWHPDKHPDQREKAERYFKIISRAFEMLSDPKARAAYDVWLAEQRSTAEPIPEVEQVIEPPKQSQQQKNMAEAWEDGRRSREQGFKPKDCPYSGDLANAWQQGFRSAMQETVTSSSKKSSVDVASKLLWASLAIGVVRALFSIPDASSVDFMFTFIVLAGTLIFVAFLIAKISAAKAWARNAYLIFFVIGLLMQPPFSGSSISILTDYIQLGLQVTALILLFAAPARRQFRSQAGSGG